MDPDAIITPEDLLSPKDVEVFPSSTGIVQLLPPYREQFDEGFSEVMRLKLVGKDPLTYLVTSYDMAFNPELGFRHKYRFKGRKITAERLYEKIYDNNSSFNHVRRIVEGDDLIIILMNEKLRV